MMREIFKYRMAPPRGPEMGGYGGGDDMRVQQHMNYEADRGYPPPAERYVLVQRVDFNAFAKSTHLSLKTIV